MRLASSMAVIALFGLAAAFASSAQAAGKEPPTCSAITFHAVPSGMTDGEQMAGLYKSRFGAMELKATVKSGEPQDYFLEVGGKQPAAAATPPASLGTCAQSKKMPAPAAAAGACTGDRFTVVIDHAGKDRLFALYGRQGKGWKFCRAGTA